MNSAFYRDLLGDIKTRVRHAQHRAVLSANAEMILMYWDIGRMIAARQKEEGWGAGVIPWLAADLKNELPEAHAAIEQGLLKAPYIFDFLTLEEPFHDRELETGLLLHVQKFLLELGRGFAFVGRQYRLEVGDRDVFIDLLFYHLKLRCFVVVDLKKGEFKPDYAGKMNFYCSAVDDLLRHEHDTPTIGMILCQTKNRVFAEYALRDIHKPIGIADYELTRALPENLASSLPSIESLEAEMEALAQLSDGAEPDPENIFRETTP